MKAGNRAPFRLPPKSAEQRVLAGVCGGLAESWRIEVNLLRVACLLLCLAWGLGILLYLLCFLLMPSSGHGSDSWSTLAQSNLGRAQEAWTQGYRSWQQRLTSAGQGTPRMHRIAMVLILSGVLILLASFELFSWVTPLRALGLSICIVGVAMVLSLRR